MSEETKYTDPTGLDKVDYDKSQVSPEVKKHVKNVRTKMYGRHVRESIARAIEFIDLTAQSALNFAKKAFDKSEDTENRLDNQIQDLTSDSEIIDFRYSKMLKKSFNILKDRGDFWDEQFAKLGVDITFFGASTLLDDNTFAIQAAIDYAKLNGFSKILIPEGIFKVKGNNLTILLKSGISIWGVSKRKSVIKISEETGDWGYLFIGGQNEVLEDVTFRRLTLDCNIKNPVTKTERWQNSNRVLINFGEAKRCYVEKCHIISNGIWGIRGFVSGGGINACTFEFYPPTYEKASFDLSTIWMGGEFNRITNNYLIGHWGEDFIPETAIETQGHYSDYSNNIVKGYKVGLIESSNTGFDNPLAPFKKYGAISNIISQNTFEVMVGGITLWAMHTTHEAIIDSLRIFGNNIKILEGNNIKSRYRYGIGVFKATPQTGAIHDGIQLGKLLNMQISDNIFEFEKRVIDLSLTYADACIRLDTEFEIEGTLIANNKFYNSGGFGIYLNANLDKVLNPLKQFVKNTSIFGNDFLECRIPIRINTGVKRTKISGNTYRQQIEYSNLRDNMLVTIEAYPQDTDDTSIFDFRNDSIQSSIEYHRPFYPEYEIPVSISKYSWDLDAILGKNEPGEVVVQGQTQRPKIVQPKNFVLDKNNVRKAATNGIQSTLGMPKTVSGQDVKIVDVVDEVFLKVTDALDFRPSQSIVIQKNDNSFGVVTILAIYKNYLFVASASSIANAKKGSVVNYYDDNLGIIA